MKPTQEQILSALNKLVRENKTELKAEKIELGMVDDLVKDAKTLSAKFEQAIKNNMAILKLVNENFKETGNLVKAAKKGYGFVSTIDKQFKELGVKPTKEYTNASGEIYRIAELEGVEMLKQLAKFKGLL